MTEAERITALEERVSRLEQALVALVGGQAAPPDPLAERWQAARAKFAANEGHH